MLVVVVIFLFITLGSAFSLSAIIYRQTAIVRNSERSTQSLLASESLQEDILYRLINEKKVSPLESLVLNGASVSAIIEDVGDEKHVLSLGNAENRIRKTEMIVSKGGSGVMFFYGVQSGQGGITLLGSAEIDGDIYSNGPVSGGWKRVVTGDVVSAGPNGLINNIAVGGNAYANRIQESWVTKDAYHKTIFNTTVGGTSYPGSPDMPLRDLPITDEQIEIWKNEAESGGTYSGQCPYNIAGSGAVEIELGHIKINCDVKIDASAKVKITGPVWVAGDISFEGASIVRIDPELEGRTIPVVVDDPTNRLNKGLIYVGGSASIRGAGEDSYLLLVSQNESAEKGGSRVAIDVGGGGPHNDILLYAAHGKIKHGGSASVPVGVTGFHVEISGAAKVKYQDGAADLDLSDTPAGGYVLRSLREVQ